MSMASFGDDDEMRNGIEVDTNLGDDGMELLSPDGEHRRRSTRASALRAQEKLRGEFKDQEGGMLDNRLSPDKRLDYDEDEEVGEGKENGLDSNKRRKLATDAGDLDPSNPHFAIQLTEDGDVLVLSDDSEVSSLHDSEIEVIKKNYVKIMDREQTAEQRRERERMIRQLQAELRLEEAKLVMLKRLRQSQQMSQKDATNSIRQNGSTINGASKQYQSNVNKQSTLNSNSAYRPPVAAPPPLMRGSNVKNGNTPTNRVTPNSSRPQLPAHQARPQLPPHVSTTPTQSGTPPSKPLEAHGSGGMRSTGLGETQTPAQRQAAAKLALRKQLEKTLLQIPPPKPPPPEMHFVPNPNQPDFVYLVGLDHVVQRVMKDKRATERHDAEPYRCLQCETDFTPVWKAVPKTKDSGPESEEHRMKLMCEQCVRTNQKKALKAEHTNRLKQAFVKALQQEQEIEQQIKEGKFNTPPPAPVSHPAASHSPVVSRGSPTAANLSTSHQPKPSSSSSAQQQQQLAQAAAAAAALRAANNPAAFAASGLPMASFPQLFGMNAAAGAAGWNPLLAGGFNAAAQAAVAALAQAASAGATPNLANLGFPGLLRGNFPKDFMKNLQQQQNALNRQVLMDMMPKQNQSRK